MSERIYEIRATFVSIEDASRYLDAMAEWCPFPPKEGEEGCGCPIFATVEVTDMGEAE